MKITFTALALIMTLLGMALMANAQARTAPDPRTNQSTSEGGLVSIIGEDGSVAIIGEDGLVSIIGEDSLNVVVAPVDSRGAYMLRSERTGRVLQLKAVGSERLPSQLRLGTRVAVKRRTSADARRAVNGQLVEADLPSACCEIASFAKDPDRNHEMNTVVIAQDVNTNVKFRFHVPEGPTKFRLANGQKLSMFGIIGPSDSRSRTSPGTATAIIGPSDSRTAWVLLPSSAPGIKGRPKVYSFRVVGPGM